MKLLHRWPYHCWYQVTHSSWLNMKTSKIHVDTHCPFASTSRHEQSIVKQELCTNSLCWTLLAQCFSFHFTNATHKRRGIQQAHPGWTKLCWKDWQFLGSTCCRWWFQSSGDEFHPRGDSKQQDRESEDHVVWCTWDQMHGLHRTRHRKVARRIFLGFASWNSWCRFLRTMDTI